MGLGVTHGAWRGPYTAFYRWRCAIAKAADVPLDLMEGYYMPGSLGGEPPAEALEWLKPRDGGPACGSPLGPAMFGWYERVSRWLPISWDLLGYDPLVVLLSHSDCDGYIRPTDCARLADRLEELLPLLPEDEGPHARLGDRAKTQTFIDGCRAAADADEPLEFH